MLTFIYNAQRYSVFLRDVHLFFRRFFLWHGQPVVAVLRSLPGLLLCHLSGGKDAAELALLGLSVHLAVDPHSFVFLAAAQLMFEINFFALQKQDKTRKGLTTRWHHYHLQ